MTRCAQLRYGILMICIMAMLLLVGNHDPQTSEVLTCSQLLDLPLEDLVKVRIVSGEEQRSWGPAVRVPLAVSDLWGRSTVFHQ